MTKVKAAYTADFQGLYSATKAHINFVVAANF